MTDFVSIPNPTVVYDFDCHWPSTQSALGTNSGFDVIGEFASGALLANLWGGLAGGGTSTMGKTSAEGLCGVFTNTAVTAAQRNVLGFSCYVPLAAQGFNVPFPWRIFRWQFALQTATAYNPGKDTFIGFMAAFGAAPGPFSSGGNNPGFGIAGSAATPGTWRYVARSASGAAIQKTLELAIVQTTLTLFDLVILGATSIGAAVVQLYANGNYGVPLVNDTFGVAGTGLPAAYGDPINGARYTPLVEQSDQAAFGTLRLAQMRCMIGHYTPAGAAL